MPKGVEKAEVKCPFYLSELKTTLRCEGVINNTTTVNYFRSKEEFAEYHKKFCENDYKNCRYAKLISERYGGF